METIKFTQPDGYETNLIYYSCDTVPRATILILHGMSEHYERYLDFIEFLNTHSIDCYTINHRGHGKDYTVANLGSALHGRGYDTYVNDVINISKYIREHKRTSSFFLFGHSFGSIIVRNVIQKDFDFSGAIVISTTYFPPVLANILAFVGRFSCLFGGKYKKSPFFNSLIFDNKKYHQFEGRTYYDWLTSDNVEVGRYINDPYCGYTYDKGFYKDLAVLNKYACSSNRMRKTNRSLPIILLSGDNDPVTDFSKAVTCIENIYDRLGFTNVSSRIYPDSRHEIIHDKSREQVLADILEFITDNS